MTSSLDEFVARWAGNAAGEMRVAQQYFIELCAALDVAPPTPQESEAQTYAFERQVAVPGPRGGAPSIERIDVYKRGHFIWENKQGSESGSDRIGHGRRGTGSWRHAMNRAFGQAVRYARHINERSPPFLVVCDVGDHIEVWSDFSGTGKDYDQRPSRRIPHADLARGDHADFLRKVMTNPKALDPSLHQAQVTRAVAEDLAALARSLESDGHPVALTARFLMRCVFTMFAEDTELLPKDSFSQLLRSFADNPRGLVSQLEHLWQLMDQGGFVFSLGKIRRFNGGLFHESSALPLTAAQIQLMHQAARHDWSLVEPTIFGTLVERALSPTERHSLGAHFTPRPYIERIVRPAVIEPLRDDWLAVRAGVIEALGEGEPTPAQKKKAISLLTDFHRQLCALRVLDPACGAGNFLYVTYDLLKDLEAEVLRELDDLGERQQGLVGLVGASVSPLQMLGIEKNPRAREIADLVLWIGHLQRLRRERGTEAVPEPVLQESRSIECRDAVLAWEGDPVPRRDADGKVVEVWDMRTMKTDPVTGREVPDDEARVLVYDYPGARAAEWPQADFIVSNPPFVGAGPMRAALGSGYAEALRAAWPHVPESADLVMYWWDRAAQLTRTGQVRRFGFITTNSIHQAFQRRVLAAHLEADPPLSIAFAVPDHPWTTGHGSAAVRIAMTVGVPGTADGVLARVAAEVENPAGAADIELALRRGRIHANLRIGADITQAVPLAANGGISSPGVKLHGSGFIVSPDEAVDLGLGTVPGLERHIRPYRNGRDLAKGPRGVMVIDLYGLTSRDVEREFPRVYQWVFDRVKPERDHNKRQSRKENWWLFGEASLTMRAAVAGLPRFIATVETSKHRYFQFLDGEILPDNMLLAIGLDGADALGVLSSRIHVIWAVAAGGRLGVGNDPRYNKTKCFDPFPFPDLTGKDALRDRIADLAERLDAHRKRVQETVPKAHLTAQYNALERARDARAGCEPLTPKERAFHEAALIGILQSLHEDLDAAVAQAYGWPADLSDEEILERLVALNQERAAEEARGLVRWLRPDFQAPAQQQVVAPVEPEADDEDAPAAPAAPAARQPWPKDPPARLLALRDALRAADAPRTAAELAASFTGARAPAIAASLATLAALGIVVADDQGAFAALG